MSSPHYKIGAALIAKNAEATLSICLASIRPFMDQIVVGVDVLSEDKTDEIALACGTDIVTPITVSELHECPQHGSIMAQHFARARNQSFERLDPQLDFLLWIDADDILKDGELLQKLCAEIADTDGAGAWCPYNYATFKGGTVTSTVFHRERLLRSRDPSGRKIAWTWDHRVHETVSPDYPNPKWMMREKPAIYHQETGHDSSKSSRRNITLLEIDLEENPNDARAIFYMGNSYFAVGDFQRAAYWYERTGEVGQNPYEKWQSWVYCSIAYERMGDLDNATKAAFCAIDVNPRHPEPYLRLACIYTLSGDFEKTEFWTQQASITQSSPPKELPPFFVFKNPLDYTFNNKVPLADALAAQGKIHQAREVLEEAYSSLPDERVGEAIAHYKSLEAAETKASAFVQMMDGKKDREVKDLWKKLDLPNSVRQFGRVRARTMPALLRLRGQRKNSPRIVFYCGHSYEEWSPLSLNTTGIGGSETAVVEIAKRFARDGWRVDVYNGAGRYEGEYDTVGYWDPERLKPGEKCDVFVGWRNPRAIARVIAPKAILWCHDLNSGPETLKEMQAWDATPGAIVCGVSAWHADMLRKYYGLHNTDYLPNGIDLERFPHLQTKERPRKEAFQVIYTSSPDRGLERLLQLWPAVLRQEPGATLHIAYGWNNIDKLIASGRQDLLKMKNEILALSEATPETKNSITWRGRLNQKELAELHSQSAVWAYPTHFLEVSCITAMEAMAGGAVPVSTACGALPETIGDAGLLVPGLPGSKAWQDMWLKSLMGCLVSPQVRWPLQYKGHQRVFLLTWDAAYAKWKSVIENLGREHASNGLATGDHGALSSLVDVGVPASSDESLVPV